MENLVEVKDVNFAYEVRPVLKGINLQVPRGKVVSIMGLSGCGKTTLLRLIGGALMPTSGEVRVAGQVTHELDGEGRGRVGLDARLGQAAAEDLAGGVAGDLPDVADLLRHLVAGQAFARVGA